MIDEGAGQGASPLLYWPGLFVFAAVFASTVRAAHTTDAPWRPRYVARPLPIPREEPVTTITLPSNSGVVMPAS